MLINNIKGIPEDGVKDADGRKISCYNADNTAIFHMERQIIECVRISAKAAYGYYQARSLMPLNLLAHQTAAC